MKLKNLCVVLLGVIILVNLHHINALNAVLKTWSTCKGKAYRTYLHLFNVEHVGDYVHRVDVNLSGVVDFGLNLKFRTNIYKNNKKVPFNFGGKDVCKAAFSILGHIATDVLKAMTPKIEAKCPIHKGSYAARNILIDVKEVKLPILIKGSFRIEVPVLDVSSNKELACIEITADLF